MSQQAAQLLDRAVQLTHKHGHSKGVLARDAAGLACSTDDPNAASFCIIGFLDRARRELNLSYLDEEDADIACRNVVEKRTGKRFLASYSEDCTLADITSLFTEARSAL